MAEKSTDRRLRTLFTDVERDAYGRLPTEDKRRINEGERVECSESGLAFHFHPQEAQVSGRELRVIVATPLPKPADIRTAFAHLEDIHRRVYAEVPREYWTILKSYSAAWDQYTLTLGAALENKAKVRAKRLAESAELPKLLASELASMKGFKAHENSDKAVAKAAALALWKERAAGKHPKLRTVEQYATEVMYRWPILQSSKVICGWSAKWTKQVKAGKNPVC